MCIDAQCTLLGSEYCGKGDGQRQLILTQVHMARSLANLIGFAGIK